MNFLALTSLVEYIATQSELRRMEVSNTQLVSIVMHFSICRTK
jgi:hypothetical protein